ncbi:MAG TPA: hypothetical protein VK110_00085 [Salinisphaeraceae bacterium]|nr:hypothetical protein [Salinisphaeraceae bacterium]
MAARARILAPGVTGGYLLAGCMLLLLWFGIGLLLLPIMAVLAVLHALRGLAVDGVARSHHLWLARHHLWATLALLLVTLTALTAVPLAVRSGSTMLNTLAQAPSPLQTLAAAWPQLGLPHIVLLGLTAFLGWLLVTLWLSIRLIRRWLRWIDRRKA